jgi:hypothetical protein
VRRLVDRGGPALCGALVTAPVLTLLSRHQRTAGEPWRARVQPLQEPGASRADRALEVLQHALRHSYDVILTSALDGDDDAAATGAMMDRLFCWGFQYPKVIVMLHARDGAFESIAADFVPVSSLEAAVSLE